MVDRAIDDAHPSLTQPLDDLVMRDGGPEHGIGKRRRGATPLVPLRNEGLHSIEENLGGVGASEQRLELVTQGAVNFMHRQKGLTLVRRQRADGLPQRF